MTKCLKNLAVFLLVTVMLMAGAVTAYAEDGTHTTTPAESNPTQSDPTGELVLVKKAEQTGNPLAGAVFGVYMVSDDVKVGELTTKTDGKAMLSLAVGDYYLLELKAPYGFLLEDTKIFFSVVNDYTVTVEVTNQRDETITDPDAPLGTIEIPKTGEGVPYANFITGALLLAVSAAFGVVLIFKRKRAA